MNLSRNAMSLAVHEQNVTMQKHIRGSYNFALAAITMEEERELYLSRNFRLFLESLTEYIIHNKHMNFSNTNFYDWAIKNYGVNFAQASEYLNKIDESFLNEKGFSLVIEGKKETPVKYLNGFWLGDETEVQFYFSPSISLETESSITIQIKKPLDKINEETKERPLLSGKIDITSSGKISYHNFSKIIHQYNLYRNWYVLHDCPIKSKTEADMSTINQELPPEVLMKIAEILTNMFEMANLAEKTNDNLNR